MVQKHYIYYSIYSCGIFWTRFLEYICSVMTILLHHGTFWPVHDVLLMNMFSCLYLSSREARASSERVWRVTSAVAHRVKRSNYSNPAALAPDSVCGIIATTPEKRRNISRSDGGSRTEPERSDARGTELWTGDRRVIKRLRRALTGNTGNNQLNAQNERKLPEHESISRVSR